MVRSCTARNENPTERRPAPSTQAPLSSRVSSRAVGTILSSSIVSSTGIATSRRIIPKAWRTVVVCSSSPIRVSGS